MWIEYTSGILSVIALTVSLVSFFVTTRKSKYKSREKLYISLMSNIQKDNIELNEYVEKTVKLVAELISNLYPKSDPYISVKLIVEDDKKVITVYSYPKKIYANVKIEDNTDFASIVKNKNEYFFVSDLKEYSALNKYRNSSNDFVLKYNTSIVCPILKDRKTMEDIIGFICVNSKKKFTDVKTNKAIIEFLNFAADQIYNYIYIFDKEKLKEVFGITKE